MSRYGSGQQDRHLCAPAPALTREQSELWVVSIRTPVSTLPAKPLAGTRRKRSAMGRLTDLLVAGRIASDDQFFFSGVVVGRDFVYPVSWACLGDARIIVV